MSVLVTFNGINYTVPEPGDAFQQSLTDYLVRIGAATFWKTAALNPALSGVFRLAAADAVAWRNQANSADVLLAKDAGDNLLYAGNNVTGNPFLEATTVAGQSIPSAVFTIVVFGTVVTDTDAAYNAGTGRYTVPVGKGGRYLVQAHIRYPSITNAGAFEVVLAAYRNAVEVTRMDDVTLLAGTYAPEGLTGATIVNCVPGDVLDVRVFQNTSAATALSSTTPMRLVIHRLVS